MSVVVLARTCLLAACTAVRTRTGRWQDHRPRLRGALGSRATGVVKRRLELRVYAQLGDSAAVPAGLCLLASFLRRSE